MAVASTTVYELGNVVRGQHVYKSVWITLTDWCSITCNCIRSRCGKTTNVIKLICYKRSTIATSEREMQTSREILRISLFSITFGTILRFIKFNNFDTRRLNRSRCLFLSFCCTTQHVFEPRRVFEPSFNMDKYGN